MPTSQNPPAGASASHRRWGCSHQGCPITFGRSADAKRHAKRQHGPKTNCPIAACNYATARPDKMRAHAKTKHSATCRSLDLSTPLSGSRKTTSHDQEISYQVLQTQQSESNDSEALGGISLLDDTVTLQGPAVNSTMSAPFGTVLNSSNPEHENLHYFSSCTDYNQMPQSSYQTQTQGDSFWTFQIPSVPEYLETRLDILDEKGMRDKDQRGGFPMMYDNMGAYWWSYSNEARGL
ncbi:hypothetical protein BP5796_08429 [Coleophoma crateriformis]|uniref:C2H2-type domain-containing protein n=1 Tax=Coleophoma crateriformis TaxID=565419 RepID=A0A3D8R7K6_9HELO|nr:hypothetical protein BP5796_08429 [Coleophoma crateriformis]